MIPDDIDGPVRHAAVGISVDALMQQWARQGGAPAGAALVVDVEIAARLRGGIGWRPADAVAVSVLSRPRLLDPSHADLAWAATGLGVARALDELAGGRHRCLWPDRIERAAGCDVATSATTMLGPGTVEFAALTARLAPAAALGTREEVVSALLRNLRLASVALDDPNSLLADYCAVCSQLGEDVSVKLLPHQTLRGRAVTIDETCALVLESRTGLRERVPITSLAELRSVIETAD